MSLSISVPVIGQPASTEAPKVDNNFQNISAWANGGIATSDVSTTFAQSAGVNQAGQTVKGATNIVASESRSNTAYGTLTTPDQVSVLLATNGLLIVRYQATWQESVVGAARAAIFLGANQIKVQSGSGTVSQETGTGNGTGNTNLLLATGTYGLASSTSNGYSGDVTTGQIVGSQTGSSVISAGELAIFASAGTYVLSVQFKASSGSVTASNRKLWVEARAYA